MRGATVVLFKIFFVYMNVLDALSGSFSKPKADCCAATKALAVLMLKARVEVTRRNSKRIQEVTSCCCTSY